MPGVADRQNEMRNIGTELRATTGFYLSVQMKKSKL